MWWALLQSRRGIGEEIHGAGQAVGAAAAAAAHAALVVGREVVAHAWRVVGEGVGWRHVG